MHLDNAKTALKKYFGYESFRPMQGEIIQSVYDRKDALVLMPTGGGKSICYQIPAITLPGTCVVISPLISLMKDQVESLKANGIKAAFLNSSQDSAEQQAIEDDFFHGNIQLLYVSPEKLVNSSFQPLLQKAKINLFAIDEAHCISAWGHDFRPEYSQLKFIKRDFPDVPIIALTATADKLTRKDILEQLGLVGSQTFVASFDRPNISLEVRPGQKRLEQILAFIGRKQGQSGIIYCLSRKSTEKLAEKLNARGIKAGFYHAGLSAAERSRIQEAFINDQVPVIAATIAFGMGIDKSNVRWIIHYNLPKNMESYYQEIGRAGRDGTTAETLLFYSYSDIMVLREILEKNQSENTEIQLAKLERMQQYAESLACRRRILLNYFSEDSNERCGNCDNCLNPPTYFDGTIIAQKALSAVYRLRESVGLRLLIDVLRGSGRKEIFERGFQNIKTYGAGREYSFLDWQHYLLQLINLGYLEIAYDQKSVVKMTPASQRVLFQNERIQLVQQTTVKARQEAAKAKAKPATKRQRVRDDLFEVLRQLRKQLAQQRGVPPYIIFSDATLEEMAARRPMSDTEMQQISGVGERKLQLYGDAFMEAIRAFVANNATSLRDGATLQVTLQLYKQGLSVEEMASKRELTSRTIYNHLAQLYENGEAINIDPIISITQIKEITGTLKYLEQPYKLKDIYERFDGLFSYTQIHFALAHHRKAAKDGIGAS
ncbi:MAG: DNA helicase RecQ [Saprospiraceae bacterium]|nr:DNA helicase RecQ [Saprospiraceae bacterium]